MRFTAISSASHRILPGNLDNKGSGVGPKSPAEAALELQALGTIVTPATMGGQTLSFEMDMPDEGLLGWERNGV